MNKPLALVASAVAAVAVILWIVLGSSKAPPPAAVAPPAEERPAPVFTAPEVVPAMAPPPTAAPRPVASPVTAYAPDPIPEPSAAPPPVEQKVLDDRTVLGMYQNMADAVDAYGKDQCPAMGQAFITFVSDGAGAIGRLVEANKARGQNFTSAFQTSHKDDLAKFKPKLREAITRCGTEPNVKRAFQALASVDDTVPDAGPAGGVAAPAGAVEAGRP